MENKLKRRIEKKTTHQKDYKIQMPIPTKNMLIELSNICNDCCIFCANRKMTREKGMISPKFLERILEEAFDLGVLEVGFYTTGEPFVNPNLAQYVSLAKKIGFTYIYITTNGALALPNVVKPIIDAGLDSIKFSINAIEKEQYYLIHGKDEFDIVMNNLKYVYEYKKTLKRPFNVFVSYISTKFTPINKEKLKQTFSQLCDEWITMNVRNQIGLVPEIDEFLKVETHDTDFEIDRVIPCTLPFVSINISYEGYLTACCTDFQNYLAYADLNKTSLKEAWNSEIIAEFREKHINKKLEGTICENCLKSITDKPTPLCSELSTDFDPILMFDKLEVSERISRFLANKKIS